MATSTTRRKITTPPSAATSEALEYKPHDAEATYKLAEVLDKTGDKAGATENYEAYLKILPDGPYAKKAREALQKLKQDGAKVGIELGPGLGWAQLDSSSKE